jgi:hypothetical protein
MALYRSVVEGLAERRISKPLVRIHPEVWSEAAGTLLQLYKHGHVFVVERRWAHMYGPPLAATECEYTHVVQLVPAELSGSTDVLARAGRVVALVEPVVPCLGREP